MYYCDNTPIYAIAMMMVLCPKAGSLAFTPPGDEMSEVVSRCPPHRQLWVSNLSKVATWGLERESNLRPSGRQASTLPMRHLSMQCYFLYCIVHMRVCIMAVQTHF